MSTSTNRKADRESLIALTEALQVSKANLRRDPCGDSNIIGPRGHISTDGVGQYVYLQPGSKRKWETAKRTLAFLTVTQDGDEEGVLKIAGTPTPEQAKLLRKHLGLRKASPLTEEKRTNLRRFSFARDKTPVSASSIAVPIGEP
jgi:hypothetical protein